LITAIAMARNGHEVTVIDRDVRPAPLAAADVFTAWHRPGTPQALLPHGFMGRARQLLRDRAPDLLAGLLDAGALDFDVAAFAPRGPVHAGDEDLRVLFCRRPLFESLLWRAAEREPRIAFLSETQVTGLLVEPARRDRPRVAGVQAGDREI